MDSLTYSTTETTETSRPAAPPRTASVLGLGHYLPDEIVSNDEIAERIGVDDEWIVKRTGIRQRRRVAPGQGVTDLAIRAGRERSPMRTSTRTPSTWCWWRASARTR